LNSLSWIVTSTDESKYSSQGNLISIDDNIFEDLMVGLILSTTTSQLPIGHALGATKFPPVSCSLGGTLE
jgi:hypothetical protein